MVPKKMENPVRFEISIILKTEKEAIKFIELLKTVNPNIMINNFRRGPTDYQVRRKEFRQAKILSLMYSDNNYTSGQLYNLCKGELSICYKTFQRDIRDLAIKGKILIKSLNGGLQGKTTLISKSVER